MTKLSGGAPTRDDDATAASSSRSDLVSLLNKSVLMLTRRLNSDSAPRSEKKKAGIREGSFGRYALFVGMIPFKLLFD